MRIVAGADEGGGVLRTGDANGFIAGNADNTGDPHIERGWGRLAGAPRTAWRPSFCVRLDSTPTA
jgi:hypothetical protein